MFRAFSGGAFCKLSATTGPSAGANNSVNFLVRSERAFGGAAGGVGGGAGGWGGRNLPGSGGFEQRLSRLGEMTHRLHPFAQTRIIRQAVRHNVRRSLVFAALENALPRVVGQLVDGLQ